jgi:arginine utilization regulatory protein
MNEQVTKVKKHLIRLENLNLPKTFTAILDLLDECIFIVDKNGHFVFYNKANEKLDKLKRGFVIGRHLTECFKLNERTSITLNVLSEQMPILDTFQDYTAASGHRIISVSSSYPLFNNKELIGALTITKDITRFKKLMYIIDKEPAEELLANGTGAYYTFDHIIGQSSLIKVFWSDQHQFFSCQVPAFHQPHSLPANGFFNQVAHQAGIPFIFTP